MTNEHTSQRIISPLTLKIFSVYKIRSFFGIFLFLIGGKYKAQNFHFAISFHDFLPMCSCSNFFLFFFWFFGFFQNFIFFFFLPFFTLIIFIFSLSFYRFSTTFYNATLTTFTLASISKF